MADTLGVQERQTAEKSNYYNATVVLALEDTFSNYVGECATVEGHDDDRTQFGDWQELQRLDYVLEPILDLFALVVPLLNLLQDFDLVVGSFEAFRFAE